MFAPEPGAGLSCRPADGGTHCRRDTGGQRRGYGLRALIVVFRRGGRLRVAEALALGETRPRPAARLTLVRNGQGRHREIAASPAASWRATVIGWVER